jgi:periplasmic mercuric ion binding protein
MKTNLIAFLSTLFVLFGLTWTVADDKDKEVKIKTSAVCEMCKERIERNLAFEKGVKEATLDVESKVLTVKYNPKKTDLSKIKTNVNKTGYDADELPADAEGYKKLPSCCKKDVKPH